MGTWGSGPFLAACLLLAWSGGTKLRRPAGTRDAARALGLPASPMAVRAFGIVELAAAALGAVFGSWGAATVAACYVALMFVAWRLLRRSPATPCGCLGASSAPVSRPHVVINAATAVVAGAAAFRGSPLHAVDGPVIGATLAVLAVCTARLVALTMDTQVALVHVADRRSRQ